MSQERYGKVRNFNPDTGFGVIKEHRTKQKFPFHRAARVKVQIKDEMPTLGDTPAEGNLNPQEREVVVFSLDRNGGGVSRWASSREFEKAAIAQPVMPIAIVKVGERNRFKVARWKFQQMFSRWRGDAKKKTKFKFARRRTKREFRDEPLVA